MSQNLTSQAWRHRHQDNILEAMDKLMHQNPSGLLSDHDLNQLSADYATSKATLKGSAGFYDFLNSGDKKIRVCSGTACLQAKTQSALKQRLGRHFKSEEIGEVSCVGLCHRNHSVFYQGQTASCPDDASVQALLTHNASAQPLPTTVVTGPRLLVADAADNSSNIAYFSTLLLKSRNQHQQSLKHIESSRLRGRGGAGFPFAIKLKASIDSVGHEKYVVCNADEGDPGAWSDRYLLEYNPHAVLFGMAISAYLSGACQGILYIRAEYPECHRSVAKAIVEWQQHNLAATMGMDFTFRIVKGHGSYVCGEETALLNAIEGKRGEVRAKPPLPVHYGLYGKPTLVSNVETFANIPWIIDQGGEAFAAIGSAESKGTKLISTDGLFKKPGLYEVPMGTKLKEFVYDVAGGFSEPVKAIQIGGPLGSVIAVENFSDLTISFESLKNAGYALGHGSMVCIPERTSMREFLTHLFDFSAKESCGKCFPCRIGTQRGYELLNQAPRQKINAELFSDLLDTLEFTSLCALGGGLPLPVRNILASFANELAPCFDESVSSISDKRTLTKGGFTHG